MEKNKIILVAAIITTAALGSTFAYSTVFNKDDNEIKVVGYKSAEEVSKGNGYETKNGYQITKYEELEGKRWFDENTLIVLKDDDVYSNPDADIEKSYISLYDLNTKTYKDYKDLNMDSRELNSVSPSGRYVLYGEPRIIPKVESEEWENAIESGELFNEKRNILDLKTGEIIRDFDKTLNNYEAHYSFINDDYIFVDYGAYWRVLDKQGNAVKEGKIEFNEDDADGNYSWLIDTKELKVEGNDISGSFYYVKNYREADNSISDGIYSMDITSNKEMLVCKYDNSSRSAKQGNTLLMETYNNNGEAIDGVYINRTFGFRIIDKSGKALQEFELPKGRGLGNIILSTTGDKCAFIEGNSLINREGDCTSSTLKIMNVKTGEVKEIVSVKSLIEGIDGADLIDGKRCRISNLSWDSTGTSLMFNFTYVFKEEEEEHTCTYVVTFDK